MSGGNNDGTILQIGIRCGLYVVLLACVGLLPALDIAANPLDREIQFTEFSFVQLTQSATLLLGLLVCGHLLYKKVLPQLFLVFMALLACALVRESDAFLDMVANGLWQTLVTLILLATIYRMVKEKDVLQTQVGWLTGQYGLGLMLSGFIVVMGFARMFGRGAMWQHIMGDRYTKTIKYFAEESVELMGYVILFIGIVEVGLAASRQFPLREKNTG